MHSYSGKSSRPLAARKAMSQTTRRAFLKGLGCGVLSSTPILGTLAHLGSVTSAAAQAMPPGGDYRALVCILLAGGNDSYNMIVPHDVDEYADYLAARSDLALDRNTLLTVSPPSAGRDFGFHPSMPEAKALLKQVDWRSFKTSGRWSSP